MTRRRLAAAAAAVVAAGTATGWALAEDRADPLTGWDDTGWAINRPVGTEFGNGWLVVTNNSTDPVRLLSVETDHSSGLSLLGTSAGPTDAGIEQILPWPPADSFGPLAGTVLVPGEAAQVVVGYRVAAPGRSTVRHVHVAYESQGQRHRLDLTNTLAVCTEAKTDACEHEFADSPVSDGR